MTLQIVNLTYFTKYVQIIFKRKVHNTFNINFNLVIHFCDHFPTTCKLTPKMVNQLLTQNEMKR